MSVYSWVFVYPCEAVYPQGLFLLLAMNGLILFQGSEVIVKNGFYDVTEVMKKYPKKRIADWRKAKSTKEYIASIAQNSDVEISTLIKSKKGGLNGAGETLIDQRLIIFFARWINPAFAVACDNFILNYIKKKENEALDYKLKACELERYLDKEDLNNLY